MYSEISRMQLAGMVTNYTDTTPLTNKQRVSVDLVSFAVNKRIYLPVSNLRYCHITGIDIDVSNYTLATDPTNFKTAPTYDDLSRGTLFVYDVSNKNIITLPLTDCVSAGPNAGKILRVNIPAGRFNIGACYVIFSGAGGLTTSYSLPFTFYYD